MEFIGKNVAFEMSSSEGKEVFKKANIDIEDYDFVPFVGFTLPEVGWHLNKENKFFMRMKNPKTAYWFAYYMGEIAKHNPFIDERKGIFHRVLIIEKGEKIDKNVKCGRLSSENIDFTITG